MDITLKSLEGIATGTVPVSHRHNGTFVAPDRTKPYVALDWDPQLTGSDRICTHLHEYP